MHNSYNVLFLCKDNAGRSLMAEAMLNHLSHGKFHAYSAGSNPTAKAHPAAIAILQKEGFKTDTLMPKHMDGLHSNQNTNNDTQRWTWLLAFAKTVKKI